MKKCIWCSRDEISTSFISKAHSIPKSLGGENICENVCDGCNSYFGNSSNKMPSIETVIKEAFNITRARLLHRQNDIGKNKKLSKTSSIYYKIDVKNRVLKLKPAYKFWPGFQENIGRQLKRGLYKIYLEELERQKGIGHNEQFDFIREYSRYGLGDLPVLYFERSFGIIIFTDDWIKTPQLFLDENKQFKYLDSNRHFFEFELLGHVFGIVTSRYWELNWDSYIKSSMAKKAKLFNGFRLINNFNDMDLPLSILDDNYRGQRKQ